LSRSTLAGACWRRHETHATEDQLLPVDNGRLIASRVPGSRLEIFDGAGHLFFWEQPQRSAELVREHAAVPA